MNIINLGILAHIDAGKTSVTENLLFASGATEKCGRVDNGDTITDSMDIEKRRGITVRASTTSIIWNGVKCNIIDTPGHMDFIAEVERTFKMLDGAVLILSAKEGIQAQTKLLFSTLQKLQIPTIIFINKIDRAGVNLERLYMDIKTNLSQDVLFMQTVVDGSVYPVCSPRSRASASVISQITIYHGFLRSDGEATVRDVLAHLDHAVDIMGIDHVGIGTDFDGDGGVRGMASSADFVNFTRMLMSK